MKELMQKALTALTQKKTGNTQGNEAHTPRSRQTESWDMSPEDALRVGTVSRYK
ncbi:hypothetical protein LPB19_14410 [Marinobacter salinisoli]|uniref:Uncharacterized protein n=1 Tax=Marinobacter salinisoli TaxID=2769486 RepID=A0ABX7MQ08_9GAMM|nr:hypothetical protein [Marinobacter salinisoli]QSP94359.1 hypothetical protein LPB19_14410 [Marinobacter salinisoli]